MSAAFESDEDEADGDAGSESTKKKKPTKDNLKRPAFVSMFVYSMKQSYILALIAMMVGSLYEKEYIYNMKNI